MNILSPSLLSADFNNIEREARQLEDAGIEWFHLDVMDGNFVPNISFGPPVIQCIRKVSKCFFDVHLMIAEPVRYVDAFSNAGADMLTIHYEACENVAKTIEGIKSRGLKCGLAISPSTPADVLESYISEVDMILVMSVNPGFGGQKFMPIALEKTRQVKRMADAIGKEPLIQVDGGITLDNVSEVLQAGANVVVAGTAVFKGDKAANVKAFFEKLN